MSGRDRITRLDTGATYDGEGTASGALLAAAYLTNALHNGIVGLVLRESAVIEIHGTGFNRDLGPVDESAGLITGQLEDGSPLSVTFVRTAGTRLELVPEPGAVAQALAALGVLAAIGRSRRRAHGGADREASSPG